jgi:hypothetical protein
MTNYRLSDYDRKRQQELRSANLAGFWIAFAVIAGSLLLYFGYASGG